MMSGLQKNEGAAATVERGRTVFFARAERLYDPDADGLLLADLVAGLHPDDLAAVRAFLVAEFAEFDRQGMGKTL